MWWCTVHFVWHNAELFLHDFLPRILQDGNKQRNNRSLCCVLLLLRGEQLPVIEWFIASCMVARNCTYFSEETRVREKIRETERSDHLGLNPAQRLPYTQLWVKHVSAHEDLFSPLYSCFHSNLHHSVSAARDIPITQQYMTEWGSKHSHCFRGALVWSLGFWKIQLSSFLTAAWCPLQIIRIKMAWKIIVSTQLGLLLCQSPWKQTKSYQSVKKHRNKQCFGILLWTCAHNSLVPPSPYTQPPWSVPDGRPPH